MRVGSGAVTDTPLRNVRIDDDLWNAAKERAAENDETVAQVIRRALREYVKGQS